jgi:hypothetical protein
MKPQQDPSPAPERDALEHELERLQRDVKRLQLEQDIVKQANDLQKRVGHRSAAPDESGEDPAG